MPASWNCVLFGDITLFSFVHIIVMGWYAPTARALFKDKHKYL